MAKDELSNLEFAKRNVSPCEKYVLVTVDRTNGTACIEGEYDNKEILSTYPLQKNQVFFWAGNNEPQQTYPVIEEVTAEMKKGNHEVLIADARTFTRHVHTDTRALHTTDAIEHGLEMVIEGHWFKLRGDVKLDTGASAGLALNKEHQDLLTNAKIDTSKLNDYDPREPKAGTSIRYPRSWPATVRFGDTNLVIPSVVLVRFEYPKPLAYSCSIRSVTSSLMRTNGIFRTRCLACRCLSPLRSS